jgi:hypothetical protein
MSSMSLWRAQHKFPPNQIDDLVSDFASLYGGIDMRPKIADAFWNPSVALPGRDIGPLGSLIAASLKLEQPPMLTVGLNMLLPGR